MPLHTLQLPLSVPDNPAHRRQCLSCIKERLSSRTGITQVQVTSDPNRTDHEQHHHALIELTYDAEQVTLAQINNMLRHAGGCLAHTVMLLVLPVEGIVSPRHEQELEAALDHLPGVTATASYTSQTIRLEFDKQKCSLPRIIRELEYLGVHLREGGFSKVAAASLGKQISIPEDASHAPPHWLKHSLTQTDMLMALASGLFLLAGFLVHLQKPDWVNVRLSLLMVSYVLGGWYPAQEMLVTLKRLRLNIDVLMFGAAFGAAALGHYEEGAMLLFLFSLGGAGERLAMNRARFAIQALARLAPRTAMRIDAQGQAQEVPVEELQIGDQVMVQPGQQIPADGSILTGRSAVNQAPITGESIPVDKEPGHAVFAGSINGEGLITVKVSRLWTDNTLAKVIRMVEEAQTTRSPTELLTDRVEHWYVPLVILGTFLLILLPPLLDLEPGRKHNSDWQGWFYQAMAFLTAASPCALAIGTPAAMLSGIARAARGGVLIKGGAHLENLGRIRAIAFDKTGTLTRGRPEITDIISLLPDMSARELITVTAALETASSHPIAKAIVAYAKARNYPLPQVQHVQQTPGLGIQGMVGDHDLTVGRTSLLNGLASPSADPNSLMKQIEDLESVGKTVVVVMRQHQVAGLVALADQPRPGARQTIQHLKQLGIRHTIMLTGDNARTAESVARQLGVDECLAGLMPQDKLEQVRLLDEKYHRVAMIGDGVNDAPALASATVGVAIGGATGVGSDVALETADIALMADDLGKLPEAIGVSRFTRRIVLQNLFIALGVIAVLSPLAALGFTPISTAVLLHEGSTVLVVINALRILGYRQP